MPAHTNTKKAIVLWPLSSSQKITGTEMMRPSVMKFGMLMITGRPGRFPARRLFWRGNLGSCRPGSPLPDFSPRAAPPSRPLLQPEHPIAAGVAQGQALLGERVGKPLGAFRVAQRHAR